MGQINIKKTSTPQTPDTDRLGLFFDATGQPKKIDDAGTETLLAGATEFTGLSDTPSAYTGESLKLVRVNVGETALEFTAPTTTTYIPATFRENNTVLFDGDYITGINSTSRSGNILFSFTGAELGATTTMSHTDASAFTFPTEAVLMFDSADISTTVANYFMFLMVDNTASSEIVHVFHAIEGGI